MSSVKIFSRGLSSLTCRITRTRRLNYLRRYPTVLVNSDGSTIVFNYIEPRKIIRLPLNIMTLTEEERRQRLERRRPKTQIEVVEDFDDEFNNDAYLNLIGGQK